MTLGFLAGPLAAQFGQNIVQYDQYDWQYIQSPYFDIYFYGDDLELAEFASEVSNEAYRQFSDRLNWQIQKRVAIMVYRSHADFQQTNVTFSYMYEGIGGVTELLKNRVVVPFEGSYSAFRHVIRHELVHALINDMIYGGSIQSIISGRIRYAIPDWLNEGLAEYLASGWDANSDMYMRDLAHHGEIPPINQLSGLYAYRGGQSLWRFITSKYGEQAIAEIFNRIRMEANVERGIEAAIGSDYKVLSEQWKESLKKQYWPDVTGRDRIKDIAHQVTDHEKLNNVYNIAPAISPDGSKVAILRNDHGIMEIVLISATDGRFLRRLIRGGTTTEFEELHLLKPGIAWAPDGKKVAFAAKAANREILYVVDINTKKVEKHPTGLEGLFMATWSPDGGTIALVGNNGSSSDIYLLDMETKELTNITRDLFSEFNPVWSPDGTTLAYSSDREDYPPYRFDQAGNRYDFRTWFHPVDGAPLLSVEPGFSMYQHDLAQLDIFVISRDGSDLRRITQDRGRENYPVYAHTAPYLFYTSDRSGIENVYMLNLETGEERAVTNVMTGISDLNMARDDQRLYFTGFEQSGYDISRIHNPLKLWDEPREIVPSVYVLADTADLEDILVNEDRGASFTGRGGDYSNYIFGFDNPDAFAPDEGDSLKQVKLEERAFKDEQGDYRVHSYKTLFTLDLVQSYAGYSTLYSAQAMTQFMFTDMLGNHRISVATEMQIDLKNSDYFVTYHLLPLRTNYYFTVFHTADFYYLSYNIGGRLRHYGFDVTASVPLSRFRRIDIGLTPKAVENTTYKLDPFAGWLPDSTEELATVIPRIGYVWDNAEWSYLHPVNGWRTSVDLSASPKWGANSIAFQTFSYDIRRYFRLFGGTSAAIRLSGGASYGPDAQNFLVGGLPWLISSESDGFYYGRYKKDPLSLGEHQLKTLYFSEYLTPLRGTQMMELAGNRAMLMNLEYRFPFLLYYFPALRMLGQLGGVLFVDFGAAWNAGDDMHTVFTSLLTDGLDSQYSTLTYGWGPRFIFLGLPFQLDYAWQRNPFGKDSHNWYLTIGTDF